MKSVDYIIAGGGAAGLSLALAFTRSGLKDRSVLIIDRDAKQKNDRTWCFWVDQPTAIDPVFFRSWRQIQFTSKEFSQAIPLGRFRYNMIRGLDFYQYARKELERFSNITFVNGNLDAIEDLPNGVKVSVDGQDYFAHYAFDSILRPQDILPQPNRYHYIKQHFLGWEIETPDDRFDPQTPVLFDFRTPQNGAMRFMYILPINCKRAVVEYTLFSPTLLKREEYESALRTYIDQVLQIKEYQVVGTEEGQIPMTDQPFPRRRGDHILHIGTKGGRVKPSSGYAFWRIQQDADAVVRSMEQFGHPFALPASSTRYRWYDTILLQIVLRHPDECAHLFSVMFQKNPIHRIFSFLDESQSIWNDFQLISTLPPLRFLQAFYRVLLLHKI